VGGYVYCVNINQQKLQKQCKKMFLFVQQMLQISTI